MEDPLAVLVSELSTTLKALANHRMETTMTCMMATHSRLNSKSPARWIGKRAWRLIFEYLLDPVTLILSPPFFLV